MRIYKTQEEVNADLMNGSLIIDDDVSFECDISIIENINARNINAWNIDAGDISACNIDAGNISACNISACNIDAGNIDAGDISACNIDAGDIKYYAVCFAYESIKCKTIKGIRNPSKHFVLDGEITEGVKK